MARYQIFAPHYILTSEKLVEADKEHPAVIKVPDDYQPSRTWWPLDAAAAKAMQAHKKELEARTVEIEVDGKRVTRNAVDAHDIKGMKTEVTKPWAPAEKAEPTTMAELQRGKAVRPRAADTEVA